MNQFLFALVITCLSTWAGAVTYTYDALNRLTAVAYGNGISQTYFYDAAGNLLSVVSAALTPQTINFGQAPAVHVGGIGTVTATATSGLQVSLHSDSIGVCTIAGTVVSGVTAGLCTIGANQGGDSTYAPAPEVLQMFSVTAVLTVPGAPTILSIKPGPGRVTITLQPPSNSGGGPIVSYSAICTASGHPNATATSTTTTIVVPGLVPGVSYACTATASNGTYASPATPATSAIPKPKVDLTPILMLLLD